MAVTCPHNMPSPASCIQCMEDGPVVEPTRWQKVGGPFNVRYEGWCATCEGKFYLGIAGRDLIQRWDFGEERTEYTHVGRGAPPRPSP